MKDDSYATSRRKFFKTTIVSATGTMLFPGALSATRAETKQNKTEVNKVTLHTSNPNPHTLDLGLGYNWFEHLGAGGHYARWINYPLSTRIYPEMHDDKGWSAIEQGLDELNVGWIRFGMPPDPHVDSTGNFIKDTIHFQHLERINNWAVKKGRSILLDMFLMPRYYEFPVPEGTKDPGNNIVNMAAASNRKYARNFVVPMMEYVINELNLKAVKLFNPINEPMEYGVYQTPGDNPPAMAHYVEMYKELRQALDEAGLNRERLGLIGLDCANPTLFTLKQMSLGVDIDPYIDAYSVHHYNLRLDHLPPVHKPDTGRHYFIKGMNVVIEQDDRMFMEYARSRNKPLWALEMGTFYYGKFSNPEGVATLDATITVAEGIIRALNTGITAFCIWSLMNPNDVDGHWAVMGQKDGQLVRYRYPFAVYGLLGNHFTPGATVYPVYQPDAPEILHVYATAIESSNKEKTIVIVNDDAERPAEVTITLPPHWRSDEDFRISLVDRDVLNKPHGSVKATDHHITIQCPPFSLIGLKAT